MSLSQRLVVFAVLAMLPVAVVALYLEYELRSAREQEVSLEVDRQTQRAASELERLVEGMRTMLVAIAAAPVVADRAADCSSYVGRVAGQLPQVYSISVFETSGDMRCRSLPYAVKLNVADRDYFRAALSTASFQVGTYTPSRISGTAVLPVALPVLDATGDPVAIVVASMDLGFLNGVVSAWRLAADSSMTVADRNGIILARTPFPDRFVGTSIPAPYLPWVQGTLPGSAEVESQDGTRRILAYIPAAASPAAGLYVSSGVSKAVAFQSVNLARAQTVTIILVGLACAVASSLMAGRVFVRRPVAQLVAIAEAWRAGSRDRIAERPGGGEFGEIAAALDRMGTDLEQREQRLRTMVRHAPYPLLLAAEDGAVVEASESWWALSGHPPGACVHHWMDQAFGTVADRASDRVANPFLVEDDTTLKRLERDLRGGNGRLLTWEFAVVPLGFLPDGRRLRLLAAADITERRETARRQDTLVAELNHRVKNTLAIVQSIGTQTAKGISDPLEFTDRFIQRLASLARTHDLLTRRSWTEVSLRDILEGELGHVAAGERIDLAGPDIEIPAALAVSICLVLHEMTTNAVKYGALSDGGGTLQVAWTIETDPTGACLLDLAWTERASKPIVPPRRQGFGSRLIERTVSSIGSGTSEFAAEGYRFRMSVKLADGLTAEAA